MSVGNILNDELFCFSWDYIDSNMYILLHSDEALIIDPNDSLEAINFLISKCVKKLLIIITHEHFDHIIGIPILRKKFDCHVVSSKICGDEIKKPSKNLSNRADVMVSFNKRLSQIENLREIPPFVCELDDSFEGEMQMLWFQHKISLIETPGHSKGSICIIIDDNVMFSGDTVLADYDTITRLPGGSKKMFQEYTIPLLKKKEGIEKIYPGHGSFIII